MANGPSFFARLYAPVLRVLARHGTRVMLVNLGDPDPHITFPELAPGYSAEPKVPLDLLPWAGREGYGLDAEFLHQASERGDRCVANYFNGELVGYGFVTRSHASVSDQIAVRISNGVQYRYKGWTHPNHRRKHLSHARGRLNSRLFPDDPMPRMISYVEAQNFPSRLTHADVHPSSLGVCLIIRVLGWELPISSRAAKRAGFTLVRLQRDRTAVTNPAVDRV